MPKGVKGFTKGMERNPGSGRPKGQPNKINKKLKPLLQEFVGGKLQLEEMEKLWSGLTPGEQARFLPQLIGFVLPKMTSMDVEVSENISATEARDILNALIEDEPEGGNQ